MNSVQQETGDLSDNEKDGLTRAERLREASRQRRSQEKQEVRVAILQASSELFLERGYASFSLRQVAERIGYSPGTIYLYFRDKDDVLMTIMGEGVARFVEMLTAAAATSDPRERLVELGRAYIAFGVGYPAYYQLMFMQRTDYLIRESTAPQPVLGIFELWRTVVEDAMQAGVLRHGDPVSTGDTLWALLHGIVSIALLMPNFDQARIDAMTETAIEMIRGGVHT
jgi:AcrR family transcriptional regulator